MEAQPTLMRWHIINELLGVTDGKRFLEIGVQNGTCGAKVRADEKWGVDPHPTHRAEHNYARLLRSTSDAFFASTGQDQRFDVILVDGLHHADQVERDVDNALRHLAPGGVIVLHDCNPQDELAQRVPREVGVWNGDCWKAMVRLRQRGDLDAFTIDTDHGVGVVRRGPAEPIRAPETLTYEGLERHRQQWLGLVQPDRWGERFGAPLALGTVAVVSAIYGGRDVARPVPVGLDIDAALLFTDGAPAKGWETYRGAATLDPRARVRKVKALALELVEADVVVWVDGRIRLRGVPLRPLLRTALRSADVAAYRHPWRLCAYDEAQECSALGIAPAAVLQAQVDAYRAVGFPARVGLWNTMVVARRRTDAARALGRAWWSELERHSIRDQVSFPFVLWQQGMRCGELGPDVYHTGSSQHFDRGDHT